MFALGFKKRLFISSAYVIRPSFAQFFSITAPSFKSIKSLGSDYDAGFFSLLRVERRGSMVWP